MKTQSQQILHAIPSASELMGLARRIDNFNKWRRGMAPYHKAPAEPPYSPSQIGIDLDFAVWALEMFADYRRALWKERGK